MLTEYQADTYKWEACSKGDIKDGQASGKKYVCDKNKAWEVAHKCFEDNSCSFFVDARDSQYYRSVKIGEQTWMAENLNYDAEYSVCLDKNNNNNCTTFGRHYNWATAMALDTNCNSIPCTGQIETPHKGICPSGWHLPSKAEWDMLDSYVASYAVSGSGYGIHLKANSWDWSCRGGNGDDYFYCKDTYGFSALPGKGGWGDGSDFFISSGYSVWWSSSVSSYNSSYNSGEAYFSLIDNYSNFGSSRYGGTSGLFSVRCVKG